ncbi:acylase and diesterase protein [Colletotrichum asianum]|uniref:Acylase and diesterase protein n=1 Tax=Colletotrichum asianum TaxID=702518 RepID=A0A8H3ZME9_9PEZI|nr:acylase and diesterase protein [Colletotrichum asianum]
MTSASDSIVVIRHDVECVTAEKHYTPCGTAGGKRLIAAGTTASLGHSPLPLDITVDEDVAVPMRDGVVVYADIYRPAHATELIPAILQVGPFGKNGGPNKHNFNKWPWRFGCPKIATSGLEGFEALDPAYWCLHGYAIVCVDTRGTWKSTGNVAGFSKKEGEDNYDVIEFLADLPWCNGKISMAGNSYLAITQWFTGAEQPPHLACLAPWEGMSKEVFELRSLPGATLVRISKTMCCYLRRPD